MDPSALTEPQFKSVHVRNFTMTRIRIRYDGKRIRPSELGTGPQDIHDIREEHINVDHPNYRFRSRTQKTVLHGLGLYSEDT